jgi:xylulose-5-phosphate/fructose-6-phosphate phosphoketolase
MPGQAVVKPNPPPLPSHLPNELLELAHPLKRYDLTEAEHASLRQFQHAANYIAASMIFLRDNVLLSRPLEKSDVKARLLGHWGTCPGLVLVWSHLNRLIRKHSTSMLLVIGPGHGAPAALACNWLEGSMGKFYPEYARDKEGLHNLITKFSVPGGHPSHVNAETPGAIHEGGELGYALAVSYGAVMDNPDLVVTCVVGDGEAETGPTAAAWHANKFIDPKESGAVIPILHVNGFKISERTIFGTMDDKELVALFSGYGYDVCFVQTLEEIDAELAGALEWALAEIRAIQKAAREGEAIAKPRWPMIVLRTPKGWSGPKEVDGKLIEGSFHSHQVPLPKAGSDDGQLKVLQDWLDSYKISELLPDGKPVASITDLLPEEDGKKLGQAETSYNGAKGLKLPEWRDFAVEKGTQQSEMKVTGNLLDATMQANPSGIRLFSPDELESNKLDAVLNHTGRNMQWDEYSRAKGGRVIEVLSEHMCQGFLQGYTLTGRVGVFPSYESFLGIIHTMMVQYAKFIKIARDVKWRKDVASINYIETSTWTRQEHNGFSHQNPSFIGAVLNLKAEAARVYLPPDANCFLSTMHHALGTKNYVNLIIGSKQPTPVYLSAEEANKHVARGAGVWRFACNHPDGKPDVVLVGLGAELTQEVVSAAHLLRKISPDLRVRMVNVTDLFVLSAQTTHPHALGDDAFEEIFGADAPCFFVYHGYRTELAGLLFGRRGADRMHVHGYKEEGTTTTPFDMLLRNDVSRYAIADRAVRAGAERNAKVKEGLGAALGEIEKAIKEIRDHIFEKGEGELARRARNR